MSHRILFVSQQLPWPLDSGGNIRTYHVLRALAERFEVVLLSTWDGSEVAREGRERLAQWCAEVELVSDTKRGGKVGQGLSVLASLLRRRPAVLTHNSNPELRAAIGARLHRGGIGALHLNHLDSTSYLDLRAAPPAVVDTHNLLHEYYARRAAHERSALGRWACRREARLLRDYERAVFGAARSTVVCSEQERRSLGMLDPDIKAVVVPNGVDCAYYAPPGDAAPAEKSEHEHDLIFVGDLAYGPNRDAVMHFIGEVLPLLRRHEPRVRFLAVGKNPSEELWSIGASRDDVVVTGFVEDVRTWVRAARLCVVPIRYGSGTRLKVLEAFAMQMPTVATTIGAEGLDVADGENILLADEPRDFAQAVLRLLAEPETAASLARAARRTVVERYDWPVVAARMVDLHARIAGGEEGK